MVSLFNEGRRLSKNISSSSLRLLRASAELISVSVPVCRLRLRAAWVLFISWSSAEQDSAREKLVLTTGRGQCCSFLSLSPSFSGSLPLPASCVGWKEQNWLAYTSLIITGGSLLSYWSPMWNRYVLEYELIVCLLMMFKWVVCVCECVFMCYDYMYSICIYV